MIESSGNCPKCNHWFKKARIHAKYCFALINDFTQFIPLLKSTTKTIASNKHGQSSVDFLKHLPFFDNDNLSDFLMAVKNYKSYLDYFNESKKSGNLILVDLNINGIHNKFHEIDEILNSGSVDILMINESKLCADDPASCYSHNCYSQLRLDRPEGRGGGGELVFIKKDYKIVTTHTLPDCEAIYFQLRAKQQLINFISAYKTPSNKDSSGYLQNIENQMFLFNNDDPFFLVGDLNLDLLSKDGNVLKEFLISNDLKNFVHSPTRIATVKKERNGTEIFKTSKTLIDVIIHNQEAIKATKVISCPFSDHSFVLAEIAIQPTRKQQQVTTGRCMNADRVAMLIDRLNELNTSFLDDKDTDANFKWITLKNHLIEMLDQVAPSMKLNVRKKDKFPWEDKELSDCRSIRDYEHHAMTTEETKESIARFKEARKEFQALNRLKIKSYFAKNTMKDFKNSKKFWEFYSASIKIRSDRSANEVQALNSLSNGDSLVIDPGQFSNAFNIFFTTLKSNSAASDKPDECKRFIEKNLNRMKKEGILNLNGNKFSFVSTTEIIVAKLLSKLDVSCGAGVSALPTKIIKALIEQLTPILTKLFNICIRTNSIPIEWKTAVVTALFKNKGKKDDMNNYRGISVLPPIAKIFEKILATQMTIYLNTNQILFKGQHGFRSNHSCETALHELLSDINNNRDKKLITLLLFIDFRKAFDLVDSDKLIFKLIHYGFDNDSLDLIRNYFSNRSQAVKFDGRISESAPIKLGVPQGSVLGPLFFLIFINDLAYSVNLCCKMFADDTTLYKAHDDLEKLISKFRDELKGLIDWCKYNTLDINWSKTFFMFITNKRTKMPSVLNIDDTEVKVVDCFKLLGVSIDNKLSFVKHSQDIRTAINRKLYSIKRLFYLPYSVKIQFFKTFVLPYFDYGLSLLIYFPKVAIQSLSNCFNMCIFKLFKMQIEKENENEEKTSDADVNRLNEKLNKYSLFTFQHRLMNKLLTFVYNIQHDQQAPALLKAELAEQEQKETIDSKCLRSGRIYANKVISKYSHATFKSFFNKLTSNIHTENYNLNKKEFCDSIVACTFKNYPLFIRLFSKFDIHHKTYKFNH